MKLPITPPEEVIGWSIRITPSEEVIGGVIGSEISDYSSDYFHIGNFRLLPKQTSDFFLIGSETYTSTASPGRESFSVFNGKYIRLRFYFFITLWVLGSKNVPLM